MGCKHQIPIPTVVGGYDGEHDIAGLFARLAALSDEAVMSMLPVIMGETLAVGSAEVELLGQLTGTDMRGCWNDMAVLPDLIRDKQLLNAVVGEVAGEDVAEANAGATAKVQRGILVDCPQAAMAGPRSRTGFPAGSPFRRPAT